MTLEQTRPQTQTQTPTHADADAAADAGAVRNAGAAIPLTRTRTQTQTRTRTLTRQHTWEPRSRGVSKQVFFSLSAQSSTLSLSVATASSCADSPVPTSQSDTESVASPTAVLKRDPDGVEAQLRGLADRRVSVEAELLRITCEETFLRRQQRRLLHGIFAVLTRRIAALRWRLPPARRRHVFLFRDFITFFLVGLTTQLFV